VRLYSYFRSSAAYRARIALNLKGIAYETVSVHLVKDGGHNYRPEFRAINPQMRVPVLVTDQGDRLIQSLAIIEYLDETHPEPPLLPKDPIADICLVPQVANARRLKVPLDKFPKIVAVDAACLKLPAFDRARPECQPDAE